MDQEEEKDTREKLRVVKELRRLVADGLLFGLWVDAWEVRVKRQMWDELERIYWKDVESFICCLRGLPEPERKPVVVETNLGTKFRTQEGYKRNAS